MKDLRQFPSGAVDRGAAPLGKDAGKVVEKATTRDVGGTMEYACWKGGHERLVVRVNAKEFLAEGLGHSRSGLAEREFGFFQKNMASQRIAVRVKAISTESNKHVADANFRAVEHFRAIDYANDRSGHIVFALLIHAGHLGGFPTNEGTPTVFAGLGETFEDLLEDNWVEFFAADVVKEIQGAGTNDGDVVDAMVHEILADGIVAIGREGDFQLGAHAVHAGDKHRFFHALEVGLEKTAEAADFTENLGTVGGAHEGVNTLFDFVAEVHIDAGGGIGFLFAWSFQRRRAVGASRRRAWERRFSMISLSNFESNGTGYSPLKQAIQNSLDSRPVARTIPSTSR